MGNVTLMQPMQRGHQLTHVRLGRVLGIGFARLTNECKQGRTLNAVKLIKYYEKLEKIKAEVKETSTSTTIIRGPSQKGP